MLINGQKCSCSKCNEAESLLRRVQEMVDHAKRMLETATTLLVKAHGEEAVIAMQKGSI